MNDSTTVSSPMRAGRPHWLTAERVLMYSTPVLVVIILFGIVRGRAPQVGDFITFWSASALALSGHAADAYDLQKITAMAQTAFPDFHSALSWHYPPTFLLVVLPLALVPIWPAWFGFMGVSLTAYVVALRGLLAPLLRPLPLRGWPHLLLPFAAFPGIAVNLVYGQNGCLTAALMGIGLWLLPRRPVAAGVSFGLLAIKPHLALLVPLALACNRQWRAFAAAAVTAVLFAAIAIACFGLDSLHGFFEGMARAQHWMEASGAHPRTAVRPAALDASWIEHARLARNQMPTLFAFLRELDVPLRLAYALHGLVALAVAAVVARAWWRPSAWPLRAGLLALGTLLVTPYLFQYEVAWLVLPIAAMVLDGARAGWRRGEREALIVVGLLPLPLFFLTWEFPLPLAQFLLLAFFVWMTLRTWADDRRSRGGDERTQVLTVTDER